MNEVFEHLKKEGREYIGKIISDIEPENIDAVFDSIEENMMAGAKILIEKLIQQSKEKEMNHWEMQSELEDIRHELAMYISAPPPVPNETDEFIDEVIAFGKEQGKISRYQIQRKWKLGYFRAGRILKELSERGYINGNDIEIPGTIFIFLK